MTFSAPRRPIARAATLVASAMLAAMALAGCTTSAPTASATPGCGGHVKEVLLGDDSATDVVSFDPNDSPKVFNLPTAPAPTCAYRTTTTTTGSTSSTITHRTYLYVGIADADAKKLIAALAATTGQAPWSPDFTNLPAPSTTPAPYALQAASWNFSSGQDRGSMGYAYNAPINPGIAVQAGLSGSPNVLRIETEVISPGK